MTLSDLASVASILSSAAVAVSLVYLGVQAHQNAKHTRALIQSSRVDRLMAQMIGFSDADKCAAYLVGNGREPTAQAIQERQFFMQCLAQSGVMLDVLYSVSKRFVGRGAIQRCLRHLSRLAERARFPQADARAKRYL
jgi:hypothetical protein